MKLYVANLPWETTNDDLRILFEKYGPVTKASIVIDKESNRSRGFAFVEMPNTEANDAMRTLNKANFNGRDLVVNIAHDHQVRSADGFKSPQFGRKEASNARRRRDE